MSNVPQKSFQISSKTIKTALIVIAIVVSIGVVSFSLVPIVNSPKPEITMVDGHDGFQGLNYVYYVDTTIKNNGVNGWVTVYAEINGGGRYEKQDRQVYLGNGESKSETFAFDISFLGALSDSSIRYKTWATAS
jgi:hypothetical protein